MKITSYNIQFGRGLDLVIDIDRICDSISGGDIICLQEVDVGWDRSNKVNQPQAISERLDDYYYVYGSSFNVDDSYRTEDGKVINNRRQHWNLVDPDNQYTQTLKHAKTDDIDIAGKIDHILVSADLVAKVERIEIDHMAAGSDHKPVHCFINL